MNIRPLVLCLWLGTAALAGCPAAPSDPPSEHDVAETLYTCGMHPQVVEDHPGTCPICGMNLTPMSGGLTEHTEPAANAERTIAHWRAPMDPTYIRDAPGKSPMGMELVPVYDDELTAESKVVDIAPGVVQQIGVETAPVERTTVFRHLRTIGEVEVGEDEISVVNLRYSGWVERIFVDRTGDDVRAGEALFAIYSPELVAAQEDYVLASRSQGPDAPLTRSARRKLELWNVSDRDLRKLDETQEVTRTMPVRAPQSGFVLQKNVVEGARVTAGQDLYRIGNLTRIWVTAEVYEHDAPWVEVGQPAQLELTHVAARTLEGTVSFIYPTLDRTSRTLKVRLEFDNPGIRLKPGMFATVYVQYRRKDHVVAVPTAAILHSGRRELVFVALGQGRFEPRQIRTGLQGDHRMTEVTEGLREGELVVTSGQFLIDSESQLQEALRKILASKRPGDGGAATLEHAHPDTVFSCPMHPEVLSAGEGRCPQCGMSLEERAGTREELRQVYETRARPGQYTCPMHPEVVSDTAGRCPSCGMFLEKVPARQAPAAPPEAHGAGTHP